MSPLGMSFLWKLAVLSFLAILILLPCNSITYQVWRLPSPAPAPSRRARGGARWAASGARRRAATTAAWRPARGCASCRPPPGPASSCASRSCMSIRCDTKREFQVLGHKVILLGLSGKQESLFFRDTKLKLLRGRLSIEIQRKTILSSIF